MLAIGEDYERMSERFWELVRVVRKDPNSKAQARRKCINYKACGNHILINDDTHRMCGACHARTAGKKYGRLATMTPLRIETDNLRSEEYHG